MWKSADRSQEDGRSWRGRRSTVVFKIIAVPHHFIRTVSVDLTYFCKLYLEKRNGVLGGGGEQGRAETFGGAGAQS